MSRPELLIACVGNIFLGDDGFGVVVAQLLADRFDPERVRVIDFGTRGFDLALALTDGYSGAILVDATRRGGEPGTLYVLEPTLSDNVPVEMEAHGLDPAKVLALARTMGKLCSWLRLVGCEPQTVGDDGEPIMGLSKAVTAALPGAVRLIESVVMSYLDGVPR